MLATLKRFFNFTDKETNPYYWGGSGMPVSSGVNVNEQTAMTYSACWAATGILAGTGGAVLPLFLFKRRKDRGREEATRHPVYRMLHDRPNKTMTAASYRSLGINWQVNWGNAYSEIQRDNSNRAFALWPIHPSRVKAYEIEQTNEIGDEGDIVYQVKNDKGAPTWIHMDDMLHVPSIYSDDGITGKGVITNAREAIGAGMAAEHHAGNFFGGGGLPKVLLTGIDFKDAEAKQNFRADWKHVHGSGKEQVALIKQNPTITQLQFNATDSQFLESRVFSIQEIARFYGVPPHMLADLEGATLNNVEQMGREFVTYYLLRWLKLWEQEFNRKLLTDVEQATYYAEHVVEGLLRGDTAARTAFYTSGIQHGWLAPNDVAALENIEPFEGGDKRFMQNQMQPIDAIVSLADAAVELAENPPKPPAPIAPSESSPPPSPSESSSMKAMRAKYSKLRRVSLKVRDKFTATTSELEGTKRDLRLSIEHGEQWKKERDELEVVATNAKSELQRVSGLLEETAKENADLIGKCYAAIEENTALKADSAKIAAQLATAMSDIERIAAERDGAREQHRESVVAAETEAGFADELNAEISAHLTTIADLESRLATHEAAEARITAENDRHKARNQELSAQNGKLEAKVETLKEDYRANSDMLTKLTDEATDLRGDVAALRSRLAELDAVAKNTGERETTAANERKLAAQALIRNQIRLSLDKSLRWEAVGAKKATKDGVRNFNSAIDVVYRECRPTLLNELAGVAAAYRTLTGEHLDTASIVERHVNESRRLLAGAAKDANDATLANCVRNVVDDWVERANLVVEEVFA